MKNNINKPILVTKPYSPPLKEYYKYINKIWKNEYFTNNGPMVKELEEKLKKYLEVKHLFYVSNGTIALQIAIKALELKGEIITTPFTYVATSNSILWEGCKPVFVDIDSKSLCIDPDKIEKAITKETSAIMPVHVFGNPTDILKIEEIAKRHNLRIIYDAAHCFGTKIAGESILNFGDISTLSFHATKLFHTIEGGAIITSNDKLAKKIALFRSFGHIGEEHYSGGINGKNSEVHAAMGLTNLPKVKRIIQARKKISQTYDRFLNPKLINRLTIGHEVDFNYAYYPVVFETEQILLAVKKLLGKNNIFPRRYFYPSLNTLPFYEYKHCPISESISKRVLCLPLYDSLPIEDVERIAKLINSVLDKKSMNQGYYTPTLTIGIPAHNESSNIDFVLKSIFKQKQNGYKLDHVIIALDGCTDNTKEKVQKWSRSYPIIKIIGGEQRKGKAARLNQIYSINNSDYLLNLDADVVLANETDLEEMIKIFKSDPSITTVAAHQEPMPVEGFIANALLTNHKLWNEIRIPIDGGDHIANLYGSATMVSRSFAKKVKYPESITADEEYLYVMSKLHGKFKYARNTRVMYRPVNTIDELRLQGTRFLTEREGLVPFFGDNVTKLHNIPVKYKLFAIAKMMIKSPIYTSVAISMNIWLRVFPKKDSLNNQGMWQMMRSTKAGINIF